MRETHVTILRNSSFAVVSMSNVWTRENVRNNRLTFFRPNFKWRLLQRRLAVLRMNTKCESSAMK
jgi:hypothetical protein